MGKFPEKKEHKKGGCQWTFSYEEPSNLLGDRGCQGKEGGSKGEKKEKSKRQWKES